MLVSECSSRSVADASQTMRRVVDAFAVGEFYVPHSAITPGELPLVIGAAPSPVGGGRLVARGVSPIVVSDYSAEAPRVRENVRRRRVGQPRGSAHPIRVAGSRHGQQNQKPQAIFECVGAPGLLASIIESCEFLARVFAAGGWHGSDSVSVTAASTRA